jgi:hypothetical protein
LKKTQTFARESLNWDEIIAASETPWPEDTEEAEAFYIEQQREFTCPFGWLLSGMDK